MTSSTAETANPPQNGDATAVAANPATASPDGFNLSHKQIVTILIGLMSGMFLAALDQMIVGTSIVKIANDLNGFNLQAWITTAYLITSTIATPIYGKLSDIYGRKPLYLAAITIFLVGSIASTFAQSMYQLAAFRAVQGLGAGGLMSLAMTILGDIVPPRERAKYQGFFLATFGIATVLGPVLGGLFAGIDTLAGLHGWRWVFLVNVPIGIVALIVVFKVLNVPHERHSHRIDWWGALALAIGVVPLLIVAEQGNEWGWGSTSSIICYALGVFGVVLFLVVEKLMKDAALIPLRLFRNGTFTVAIVGGFIVGVAMFGAMTMIPQYMQVVQGYTPTQSGLLMVPVMLGIMGGSIVSGQITSRTGRYKVFPIVGTLMIAVGAIVFAQVSYDSALWHPLLGAFIIGLGLGNCMQTLIIAVQNAGPRSDMGVSTATATFSRQIGGTAGVAVFLTILFNVLPGNITKAFGGNIPQGAGGQISGLASNTSLIDSLPDSVKIPVLIGFTDSITTVFYVAAGVALLAFIVLWFMKEIPLAGGAPAASTMEGAEGLLEAELKSEEGASETQETSEESEQREPALVGAAATSPSHNGRQEPQLATLTTPMAIANNGFHSAVLAGEPISGYVRRQDGSAVRGAALTLINQLGHQVSRATSEPDGAFSVGTPDSGAYVLIVSAPGHQPQASSIVLKEGVPSEVNITLTGSGELHGVVRIAGRGEPLAGATITLTDHRGEVNDAVITTEAGAYAFHGVGAGNYTLVASAERFRPIAAMLSVPETGEVNHDIELVGSILLKGVARAEDRVVPDARITVLAQDGSVAAVTRTDLAGEYLINDLPEGDYTVIASGYPPATSQVDLLAGTELEHDVQLGYDEVLGEFTSEDIDRSGRVSLTGTLEHDLYERANTTSAAEDS